MRSSDVYLGLPYDVQQLMAHWLGAEIGPYVHFAASRHVYERARESAMQIVEQPDDLNSRSEPTVDLDYANARDQVAMFFWIEQELREGRIASPEDAPQYYLLGTYLQAGIRTVARSIRKKAHSEIQLQLGLAV